MSRRTSYAYEAAAGAFVDTSITATEDLGILWDVRSRFTLVADDGIDQTGLLDILRKVDRSFELSGPRSYRAINRDGYMVDLIKSEPKQMLKKTYRNWNCLSVSMSNKKA